jgi:hypothetical protein
MYNNTTVMIAIIFFIFISYELYILLKLNATANTSAGEG